MQNHRKVQQMPEDTIIKFIRFPATPQNKVAEIFKTWANKYEELDSSVQSF